MRFESLEQRAMLAFISGDGGKGGVINTVPVEEGLNVASVSWQNFNIPDEFQVQFDGKRIIGDVGLQSGGGQGQILISGTDSAHSLIQKTTAPIEGTEWNFSLELKPYVLIVDAKLGDVTKVDIPKIFHETFTSTLEAKGIKPETFKFEQTSNSKGAVAEIDNWQNELKRGIFYFVPRVSGDPLNYGEVHSHDPGLGTSQLLIHAEKTDSSGTSEIVIPITFVVSEGFSTMFSDTKEQAVDGSETSKLDIYRQQQRLAYLGFPDDAKGTPINVDGTIEQDDWARKLFSISLDPKRKDRGLLPYPSSGIDYFKTHIDDLDAPHWVNLTPIIRFNDSDRRYGLNTTGDFILKALAGIKSTPVVSNGVSFLSGRGWDKAKSKSKSHEGGRSIDIDDVEGDFFKVKGSFVAANEESGGDFIVKKADGSYRGGGKPDADLGEKGLTVDAFEAGGASLAKMLQGMLDYKINDLSGIKEIISAFVNAGSTLVIYNDPRIFGVFSNVIWTAGHYDHIHFGIPSPLTVTKTLLATSLLALSPAASYSSTLDMDVGNTAPSNATKLNRTGFLGVEHLEDLYEITAAVDSTIQVNLSNLNSLDVSLSIGSDTNHNGQLDLDEIIAVVDNESDEPESLNINRLPAGNYLISVRRLEGESSYDLKASMTDYVTPADHAGSTPNSALNLGIIHGSISKDDFVGSIDLSDLYSFEVGSLSSVDITLTGLEADADVKLYSDRNANGILEADELVSKANNPGNQAEDLLVPAVKPGKYYALVTSYYSDTHYSIKLTTGVARGTDIRVDKQYSLSSINLGDHARYRITVTNDGPEAAENVVLTEVAPIGLQIQSVAHPLASFSDRGFTTLIGELGPGQSASFDIEARAIFAGQFVSTSLVTSDTFDYDLTNNSSEKELTVQPIDSPPADLEVTQETSEDEGMTYISVILTNKGPGSATAIQVKDLLPDGITFLGAYVSLGSYDDATGIWNVGNMPAAEFAQLEIVATRETDAKLFNTVEVIAMDEKDIDSVPGNGDPSEDDYSRVEIGKKAETGLILSSAPLVTGLNRILVENATPQGIVNLYSAASSGEFFLPQYGITLNLANPSLVAQAIVQPDGTAILYVNLGGSQLNNTLLQAIEMAPEPKISNVIPATVATSLLHANNVVSSQARSANAAPDILNYSYMDTNNDGVISSLDLLAIINQLNSRDRALKMQSFGSETPHYSPLDMNDDGQVSSIDALKVINFLNSRKRRAL